VTREGYLKALREGYLKAVGRELACMVCGSDDLGNFGMEIGRLEDSPPATVGLIVTCERCGFPDDIIPAAEDERAKFLDALAEAMKDAR